MTPEEYRAAVARRHAWFKAWDAEYQYRIEERMGLRFGAEVKSRKRIVVIHEVMVEMDSLHWRAFV